MRKQIARAILVLVAVVGVSSTAWAASIPVGFLTYTEVPGAAPAGFFSITNQTGDNQQPGFPVLDFVSFAGMTLTVNGGSVATVPGDFTDANPGHPNYEFDSATFGIPTSAVIGGAAPAGPFQLEGGGMWLFTGNFFTDPGDLGNGVDPIPDGEFSIIYVEAREVVVPEPMTLSLLGLGLVGVVARRRMAAARS